MTMVHLAGQSETHLSGIDDDMVQPNGVDLRVGKLMAVDDKPFVLQADGGKQHRGSVEFEPDHDGRWVLHPGVYEIVMDHDITISEGEAGYVLPRSTLVRNGVILVSGLYDSGFSGKLCAVLHVTRGVMFLEKGARVGQFICFKSETLHSYDGDYGFGSLHDTKYE